MKIKPLIIIFPLLILTSCGLLFRSGIENAMDVFVHVNFPDSCDLHLIKDLAIYRSDSLKLPAYATVVTMKQSQSISCQESFDSINIISYGIDSVDLFMIKIFKNTEGEQYWVQKYYRLGFKRDTLVSISPHLITSKDKY